MNLRERQSIFALNVAKLIIYIYSNGYAVTFGEAYRPPEMVEIYTKQGKGSKNSLHPKRLAIDLNLFKDGKYLSDTDSHRIFGEYWEKLHPHNRWGGRFRIGDGNHYEMQIINEKEIKI